MLKSIIRFLKLLLFIALIFYALMEYRVFSFEMGISKFYYTTNSYNNSIITKIKELSSIQKVEYYEIGANYKLYIKTSDEAYLLDSNESEINDLSNLSILSGNLKPKKIHPISIIILIIVGILIIIFPNKWGKRNQNYVQNNSVDEE